MITEEQSQSWSSSGELKSSGSSAIVGRRRLTVETSASHDVVDMAANGAWGDDRVQAGKGQRRDTGQHKVIR